MVPKPIASRVSCSDAAGYQSFVFKHAILPPVAAWDPGHDVACSDHASNAQSTFWYGLGVQRAALWLNSVTDIMAELRAVGGPYCQVLISDHRSASPQLLVKTKDNSPWQTILPQTTRRTAGKCRC